MNLHRAGSWGLLVVAVLGGVAVTFQHRELSSLTAEKERRLGQVAQRTEALSAGAIVPPANPAPPLNASERLELMTLRRQVTELSEVKRRAARVVDENSALRAQSASISNRLASPFPPGWVKRSEARQAGFNTPEAAFESFVWALHHRDTNILFQALVPEMHETLARNWASDGPEGFWAVASKFPGFLIRKTSKTEEGTAKLEVEIAPGAMVPEVTAKRLNGAWRLRLM